MLKYCSKIVKLFCLLLILVSLPIKMVASNLISSVNAYQSGKDIIITYELSKQSDIAVSVSTDGGKTYKTLNSVYGDVGNTIKPGSKKIVWDVLSEFETFKFAEVQFKVESNFYNGHEYVDLGLPSGTLWATCNVGASKPEEYGDYFAWGETKPKYNYKLTNYKWCKASSSQITYTKYCKSSRYGKVDNKTVLELADDVANTKWGSSWRIPTGVEINEILENCIWELIKLNGVNCYKVISKINGNSIFLPFAGSRTNSSLSGVDEIGEYWSSSLNADYSFSADYLFFKFGYVSKSGDLSRSGGKSVRPVLNK